MMAHIAKRLVIALVIVAAICSCALSYQTNKALEANEATGRRMAAEVSKLLADPSISAADKARLNAVVNKPQLAGLARGAGWSRGSNRRVSSGLIRSCRSKTCCKVIIPPLTKQWRSRVSYRCVQYYSERYRTKCGTWGWRRCRRTRTRNRQSTCYRTHTRYYSVPRACPAHQKTCCEGYFWFGNCCVNIRNLQSIMDDILRRKGK